MSSSFRCFASKEMMIVTTMMTVVMVMMVTMMTVVMVMMTMMMTVVMVMMTTTTNTKTMTTFILSR